MPHKQNVLLVVQRKPQGMASMTRRSSFTQHEHT